MVAKSPHATGGVAAAKKAEQFLVLLLALGAVATLFVFRALDDNRLTRWDWAFAHVDPAPFFGVLIASLLAAYGVAKLALPGRRVAPILFLFSYAVGACFWGAPEAIVDASRYFTQAKHLEIYGVGYFLREWGGEIPAWTDLPLVPFLYGLIFKTFGESRIYIQAFTTLLFSSTVVLTYWIGRTLWNEDVGFWAGALLLGIPYLLTQVPSMLVDVPTMFFLTLATFAFIRALHHGGTGRTAFAAVALLLAFFSKYSVWLMLSVLLLVALIYGARDPRGALRRGGAIALISALLIAATIIPKFEVFSEQIALLLSYQAPGLRRWGESHSSTFLFQIHPFVTGGALLSLYVAARRRDPRYLIIAWPMLLLILLQIQRIRYMIPVFPMLSLMAAYGLQAIRSREVRNVVVTCAVASSLVVALYGYLPFLGTISTVNLKRAGEYLDAMSEGRAEAFTLDQGPSAVNPAVSVPILDLFTSKRVSYAYDSTTSPGNKGVEESSLRFTWEYRNPRYYAIDGTETQDDPALVVISRDMDQRLPERIESRLRGYRLSGVFAMDENVFHYKTVVKVYRPG